MELEYSGGFFHFFFFFFAALGLNLAELLESSFELAGKAMFVAAEVGEGADLFADGSGHGQSGLDFRVSGGDIGRLFVDAESKKISFKSGDAIDAPGSIGEGLNELLLEGAFGLEVGEEALGVRFIGGVVLSGQDDDVAGESMAEGVEGGTLFTGGGAGAGGVLGVGAVGFGAGWGVVGCVGHFGSFLILDVAREGRVEPFEGPESTEWKRRKGALIRVTWLWALSTTCAWRRCYVNQALPFLYKSIIISRRINGIDG